MICYHSCKILIDSSIVIYVRKSFVDKIILRGVFSLTMERRVGFSTVVLAVYHFIIQNCGVFFVLFAHID